MAIKKHSNMVAKNAMGKKQGVAVSGKPGKIPAKPAPVPVKGKGHEGKQKLVFPAESDEDEDESEDEDEMEDEDEEISEVSDEDGEESASEDEQPSNMSAKNAISKKQVVAVSGKPGKIPAKPALEPVKGKGHEAKPKVALPAESDEDDSEDEDEDEEMSEGSDEDEEESASEGEQHSNLAAKNAMSKKQSVAVSGKAGKIAAKPALEPVKGKGHEVKPKVVLPAESDEDDSEDEDEDEEMSEGSDEEGEESASEGEQVSKKAKIVPTAVKPVTAASPAEQSVIVKEEERRRQDRNSRSLFVKGIPPKMSDSDLKKLDADIIQVRRRNSVGWFYFNTKDSADKAKLKLSQVKLPGEAKPLFVDFCDERSSKPAEKKPSKSQWPINPLELVAMALPKTTNRDQLQTLFKKAVHITFDKRITPFAPTKAFIRFDNEKDASEAFEKTKNLKIGGEPIDVMYARINQKAGKNQNLPKQKPIQSGDAKKMNGHQKNGAKPEDKSPTKDEQKAPESKQFKPVGKAAFKKGTPPSKGFPAKSQSFNSASKGTKRPFKGGHDQGGFKKGKKPRV